METLQLILKNWEKFAFVGAAFGYGLKVIYDFRFKKKEIFYHLYATEELKAVLNFFTHYHNLQLQITNLLGYEQYKPTSTEDLLKLQETLKIYGEAALFATFFFNENSKRQSAIITQNFNQSIEDIKKIVQNTSDPVMHSVSVTNAINAFWKRVTENQKPLSEIRSQFQK